MRNLSISMHFVRAVLKNAPSKGLDPIQLLRDNRISPRLLSEDNTRISIERYADLQVATMLAMDDESLGYAPRPQPVGSWAMMCHAVIHCDVLGQAMARYCRFYQLFGTGYAPVLEQNEDSARLRLDCREPCDPFLSELLLYNSHRFASWLVQEMLPINRMLLGHPPEAQPQDYRRMFLANPVEFDAPEARWEFSPSLLEKRVAQNENSLRHFLRHPVLLMLTQDYAKDSWTGKTRTLVRHNLHDLPELASVAEALDIHPQTLRRRLATEGTTFKEIKNQVRRDTALHFLGKRGLSIEEIAHRSGFSESSAFIRAFKGWTGVTPYNYRKGL